MLGKSVLALVLIAGLCGLAAVADDSPVVRAQDKKGDGDIKEEEGTAGPEPIEISLRVAKDDKLVVRVGRRDSKEISAAITKAAASETAADVQAALDIACKLGRAADIPNIAKLLDHTDWEIAERAFRLVVQSPDKAMAKHAFRVWDKHEADKSDRLPEVREVLQDLNWNPDNFKLLVDRAKGLKHPETQAKAALELLREALAAGDDGTLEEIEKMLKKGDESKMLKGASADHPTKTGAMPVFFPDALSAQKKGMCGGNHWLVKGSTITVETASITRASTKDGWSIKFKVFIPGEKDEIQLTFEHQDLGNVSLYLNGTERILGADKGGGKFPMANAGKWVDVAYTWTGDSRTTPGENVNFLIAGQKIGKEKNANFIHGNAAPKLTVKGVNGNVFLSPGEIEKADKLPK